MEKKELVRLVEIAIALVEDPRSNEHVAFSANSLRDVLYNINDEIGGLKELSADQIVALWRKNVRRFRQTMLENAKKDESFAAGPHGPLLLLREDDAGAARQKCRKGAGGFHRPRTR